MRWKGALSLFLLLFLLPSSSLGQEGIEKEVREFIRKTLPNRKIEVKDLKVAFDQEADLYVASFVIEDKRGQRPMMFYISKDRKLVFVGKVYQLESGKDLTFRLAARYLPPPPRRVRKIKKDLLTLRGPSLGSGEKKVVIISSPTCPHCRKLVPELIELVKKDPHSFTLFYKHFSLSSKELARALEYVREKHPDSFWELIQICYQKKRDEAIRWVKEKWGNDFLEGSKEMDERIKEDVEEAEKIGVDGIPAAVVDETLVIGERRIREYLKLGER